MKYNCYNGICLGDNKEGVYEDCRKLNDSPYNPKESGTVVSAISQVRNVQDGTCNGTLYTTKNEIYQGGWLRLKNIYCNSPLVKKEIGNYNEYLRLGNYYWFPPGKHC